MGQIVSQTTSIQNNGDGTSTASVGAGSRWYQNDSAIWTPVIAKDPDNLPGNCQMISLLGGSGYRLWKPRGNPPYNPEWLPTDYWLQVEDQNDVTDFSPQRSTITEQAVLTDINAKRPAWKWTWNDNLTYQGVLKGLHTWVDSSTGVVVFNKYEPRAWSQAGLGFMKPVFGTATLDADGNVTVKIDLTKLSFPVVMDPTTGFNGSTADGYLSTTDVTNWANVVAATTNGVTAASALGLLTDAKFAVDDWEAYHMVEFYDTSAIGTGQTVSAWTETLKGQNTLQNADTTTMRVKVYTGANPLTTSDIKNYAATTVASFALAGWNVAATNDITGSVMSAINMTGITGLYHMTDIYDVPTTPTGVNDIRWNSADGATVPVLTVTYAPTATGGSARGLKRGAMQRALMLP